MYLRFCIVLKSQIMSGNKVQPIRIWNSFRSIHQSTKLCENKASENSNPEIKNTEKKVPLPGATKKIDPFTKYVNVRLIDKWLLVWFKKYKSVKDVPNRIQEVILDNVQSRSRIRIANYLMGIILIACVYAVWSGKKAVEEGDSFAKRIEERHRKAREEHLEKLAKGT